MAPGQLRRFLHLERPRPARPPARAAPGGVEARFRAVLEDVERRAAAGDRARDDPPDGAPVLRWLRRRWW